MRNTEPNPNHYRRVDADGYFVEDVMLDTPPVITGEDGNELPDPLYIATPCPDGFYRPRWDGSAWTEGGQAPEPTATPPTLEERVAATESAVMALLLGGDL